MDRKTYARKMDRNIEAQKMDRQTEAQQMDRTTDTQNMDSMIEWEDNLLPQTPPQETSLTSEYPHPRQDDGDDADGHGNEDK